MFQREVFVVESCAIDWLSTSAIMIGEITTLAHEIWDHPMEAASFVAEALLTSTEGSEIFCCLWHDIASQLKIKLTFRSKTIIIYKVLSNAELIHK